jgi:multiple sugar transport system ATP-binding protein
MTLSTQVAVLNNGYLQQLAPPERIYDRPANQFVAGFVGSPQMNLLTLPCQDNYALLGDFKIRLPDLPTVPPQIVLGVRPEHLHLAETENTATLKGNVFLVENLGMHNLVSIKVANAQDEPIVLRVLLPPERWSNRELSFTLPPDEIHWFDVQSGDSLVRQS